MKKNLIGLETMMFILGCVFFMIALASPVFGSSFGFENTCEYALIQLGNDGGSPSPLGGDKLEITSNSSVFGSTLKGVDDKPELNKITTSKVTVSWDRETGVVNDSSSSYTGSKNTMPKSQFEAIADNALSVSSFWAGQTGTNTTINLNGVHQTITASEDGANVYNITGADGFIMNSGAKLTLTGNEGAFFVFNISADSFFSIQSNSIIELGGDIEASEVLFNVLGNIGVAEDDGALIGGGSIFQGTLLAPGRKVEITQNHFYTFDSEGFEGTQAPETTEITAAQAISEKEAGLSKGEGLSSWGGLWGQIIAGGAINFTESDISHQDCAPVPIPKADIIFAFDLTGSMGDELATMKAEAINIMNELSDPVNPLIEDAQYGVVSMLDYPQKSTPEFEPFDPAENCEYVSLPPYYGASSVYAFSLNNAVTDDRVLISDTINGLTGGDGGDPPESYTRLLYESYANPGMGWRSGSKKIIILLGDDVPHDCNINECLGLPEVLSTGMDPGRDGKLPSDPLDTDGNLVLMDVLAEMAVNEITLLTVWSKTAGGMDYSNYWDCWTAITGGQNWPLDNPEEIPDAIKGLIIN